METLAHSVSFQTASAIGMDIGGTKIASATVTGDPHQGLSPDGIPALVDFQQAPTPDSAKPFLQTLVDMVTQLRQQSGTALPLATIGIATAGIVDSVRGEVLGATGNLPALRGIPSLKQALEAQLGLPVYIENDANAAAYGEYRCGAAKGSHNVLMITLGTGVGTGMIIDGRLVTGAHFSAGEGGHIAISMNHDRLCTCGKWDCWETYASGTGLAETARRMLHAAPNAEASALLQGAKHIEDVTTRQVIQASKAGDPLAEQVLDAWHTHIAVGLGSVINILDPDVVVVGGGMAPFVDFERLTERTQQRAMMPIVRNGESLLKPAILGNKAGLLGAAYLAMEHLGR